MYININKQQNVFQFLNILLIRVYNSLPLNIKDYDNLRMFKEYLFCSILNLFHRIFYICDIYLAFFFAK